MTPPKRTRPLLRRPTSGEEVVLDDVAMPRRRPPTQHERHERFAEGVRQLRVGRASIVL